jgi:rubredoxin
MLHEGQETSRKLVWVEGQGVAGWGCSECAWLFIPAIPLIDDSFEEMTRRVQLQLDDQFMSHNCTEHPKSKAASL